MVFCIGIVQLCIVAARHARRAIRRRCDHTGTRRMLVIRCSCGFADASPHFDVDYRRSSHKSVCGLASCSSILIACHRGSLLCRKLAHELGHHRCNRRSLGHSIQTSLCVCTFGMDTRVELLRYRIGHRMGVCDRPWHCHIASASAVKRFSPRFVRQTILTLLHHDSSCGVVHTGYDGGWARHCRHSRSGVRRHIRRSGSPAVRPEAGDQSGAREIE